MNAYDLYLKGFMAFSHRAVQQDVIDSINWLEQAVALDPEFAAAWEALAATYVIVPFWGVTDRTLEEYLQLSTDAVDRALGIEPELVLARAVKANILESTPPHRLVEALREYERALALEPTNVTANHWYGISLLLLGYFEEGITAQQRCLDVDPAYFNCAFYLYQALHAVGRHQEAEAVIDAEQFEQISWTFVTAINVPLTLLRENRLAALIIADIIDGLAGAPGYEFVKALEHPEEDHSEGLRKFDAWATENDVDLSLYPEILAAFGAYDRVENTLNSELWYWLPNYKRFRQSPEFRRMMRDDGNLQYWQVRGFPAQCRAVGADDFECD
jgi:tetratricopeptide (TPR) repeat protein